MRPYWLICRNILIFVLCLELFFWAGAWVNSNFQIIFNAFQSRLKGDYKILCIGDSITEWGGKDSYPAQLERILNQRGKTQHYSVINQGIPGANCNLTYSRLPQWLDLYQPNMVIIMLGASDHYDQTNAAPSKNKMGLFQYSKIVQVIGKVIGGIKVEFENRLKIWFFPKEKKNMPHVDETFETSLLKQSEDQQKLYVMIRYAEGVGRDDVADALYEKFLQINQDEIIHKWVSKEYARLLVRRGEFEKFVYYMNGIPYDGWPVEWVKGYCHGDVPMERVRGIIEKMVENGTDSLAYGNVVSCYEEGGNALGAELYQRKLLTYTKGQYSKEAKEIFLKTYMLLRDRGIQAVFMQYPLRDSQELRLVFGTKHQEGIMFIDNASFFKNAVVQKSYDTYFMDRVRGDFGHMTPEGGRLLAEHVADEIGQRVGLK